MPWQERSSSRRSRSPVITHDHLWITLTDHLWNVYWLCVSAKVIISSV
ncbi:hypothetical protein [uncultured Nostoc sp.]